MWQHCPPSFWGVSAPPAHLKRLHAALLAPQECTRPHDGLGITPSPRGAWTENTDWERSFHFFSSTVQPQALPKPAGPPSPGTFWKERHEGPQQSGSLALSVPHPPHSPLHPPNLSPAVGAPENRTAWDFTDCTIP